jgi:hypothetical protein
MPHNIFKIYDGRNYFWQWDTNQKLIVLDDTIDEVHFSHKDMKHAIAKDVCTDKDGLRVCHIPDALLTLPKNLIATAYVTDDGSNRTIRTVKFGVRKRLIPSDYIVTEDFAFADFDERLSVIEDIIEDNCLVQRFNTLEEAEQWAKESKDAGAVISVKNEDVWITYVVAEDYSIVRICDCDKEALISAIERLQKLIGEKSVDDQIKDAIDNLDLSNEYDAKGAAAQALKDANSYTDKNADPIGAAQQVQKKLDEEIERAKSAESNIEKTIGDVVNGIHGFVSYEKEQELTDEQRAQARRNIGSLGYNWHTIYEDDRTSIQFANYNENSSISNWESGLKVPSKNGLYRSALGEFLHGVYYILRTGGPIARSEIKLFVDAGKALIKAGVLVEDSIYKFACTTSAQNAQIPEEIAFVSVWHESSKKQWQIVDAAEWRLKRAAEINDDYIIGASTLVTVDKTLTKTGRPADAKAVGDALNELSEKMDNTVPTGVVLYGEPQSLTDEQKAQARENIGVEADWSENDPSAPGYIKNRTHWVDISDGKVLFDEIITFNGGEYLGSPLSGLEEGKTYKVTFDGIEYTCKCKVDTVEGITLPYIGNLAQFQAGLTDTGEPFVMGNYYAAGGLVIIADVPSWSYECGVTIAATRETIHKIDSKFLPEGVPSIETIATDTITFDGNMDGKLAFAITSGADTTYFVKVSDGIVDSADVIGGTLSVVSLAGDVSSATLNITPGDITDASIVGQKGFVIGNSIGVVTEAGMFNGQPVEKGIYFGCVPGAVYITELKLPKKSIKADVYHKLDNKLLDLEWIPAGKQDVIVATSVISSSGITSITGKCDLNNIDEVEVTWDGVNYTCKVIRQDVDDAVWLHIGNLSIDNGAAEDNTGEPFFITLICDFNGNITGAGYLPNDSDTHIFSVRTKKIYEKLPSEFLPEGGVGYTADEFVEVFPSTQIYAESEDNSKMSFINGFCPKANKTYKVVIDGKSTIATAREVYNTDAIEPFIILGNWAVVDSTKPSTGEDFVFIALSDSDTTSIFSYYTDFYPNYVTISISELVQVVHKIDSKFLPESVATNDDISALLEMLTWGSFGD